MTRHLPKAGHFQPEPVPLAAGGAPESAEEPTTRAALGWRIALFVWLTAFAFLLAYEMLSALFKVLFSK